jgi:hypothetical protein
MTLLGPKNSAIFLPNSIHQLAMATTEYHPQVETTVLPGQTVAHPEGPLAAAITFFQTHGQLPPHSLPTTVLSPLRPQPHNIDKASYTLKHREVIPCTCNRLPIHVRKRRTPSRPSIAIASIRPDTRSSAPWSLQASPHFEADQRKLRPSLHHHKVHIADPRFCRILSGSERREYQ